MEWEAIGGFWQGTDMTNKNVSKDHSSYSVKNRRQV